MSNANRKGKKHAKDNNHEVVVETGTYKIINQKQSPSTQTNITRLDKH